MIRKPNLKLASHLSSYRGGARRAEEELQIILPLAPSKGGQSRNQTQFLQ
ncbi:MAG: hypothetical protein ACJAVN_000331 [Roseivirga sp.]|jgi:hypothetical protein